ncbi:MAG: choice-of-anchor Q domain-containing protein, partial [Leadbetterella sp.]|nr:choice-of-anchor Q domain-containing protein [Leadbetterella sp.]
STQGSTPIFDHCTFINNKAWAGGAMYLAGGNPYDRGIEFDHCRFEGNYAEAQGGVIYFYNTIGKETIDFVGCTVTKNNCMSFGSFFHYFKTGNNFFFLKIDSCDISSNMPNASSLIYLEPLVSQFKTKFVISNSTIADNKVSHPDPNGYNALIVINNSNYIGYTDTIIISKNVFSNNSGNYGSYLEAGFMEVNNNLISNSTGFAFIGKNVGVSNNVIVNCKGTQVGKFSGSNSKGIVKNNIFMSQNPFPGLVTSMGTSFGTGNPILGDTLFILNNIFWKNKIGILQGYNSIDSILAVNILSNNIFLQNETIIKQNNSPQGYPGENFAYFSHNLMDKYCTGLSDRVICGPGNIPSLDALIIDATALNFHLQPCSQAINKGNNALLSQLEILQDLEGNPRISEGTVDIGPYESPG